MIAPASPITFIRSTCAVLITLFSITAHAQTLERDDVMPLFQLLDQGNWHAAFDATNALIKAHPQDTSDLMGVVNYASILSASALVAGGKMSYRKMEKHVQRSVGKHLWMAAHPATEDTNAVAFNTNVLYPADHPPTAHVTATNEAGTTIYTFEDYTFDEGTDVTGYEGANTRMGGVLESFSPNPNGSLVWILRLRLVHARIRRA